MKPFGIPDSLRDFTDPHPASELVLTAAGRGGDQARLTLVRLWLSEGIPYAFRDCPAIYESVRTWLSVHLGVHAKEITIVGSARTGASLAPAKLGKRFSTKSDLDLVIVSEVLFEKLREEFCQWSLAFETGGVAADNATEEAFWRDNIKRVPKNILAGFVDPNTFRTTNPTRLRGRSIRVCTCLLRNSNVLRTPRVRAKLQFDATTLGTAS